ncbi:MAG: hypothetical protein ACTSR2_01165 [Candidatus Hodarchaeales archaeon]
MERPIKVDIKAIRRTLRNLGLKHIIVEFDLISKYETKYYKYFANDETNLIKKFRELRENTKDFAEWEEKCINFGSFDYLKLTKQKRELIKLLFGNERGWNYHVFWILARFYIY